MADQQAEVTNREELRQAIRDRLSAQKRQQDKEKQRSGWCCCSGAADDVAEQPDKESKTRGTANAGSDGDTFAIAPGAAGGGEATSSNPLARQSSVRRPPAQNSVDVAPPPVMASSARRASFRGNPTTTGSSSSNGPTVTPPAEKDANAMSGSGGSLSGPGGLAGTRGSFAKRPGSANTSAGGGPPGAPGGSTAAPSLASSVNRGSFAQRRPSGTSGDTATTTSSEGAAPQGMPPRRASGAPPGSANGPRPELPGATASFRRNPNRDASGGVVPMSVGSLEGEGALSSSLEVKENSPRGPKPPAGPPKPGTPAAADAADALGRKQSSRKLVFNEGAPASPVSAGVNTGRTGGMSSSMNDGSRPPLASTGSFVFGSATARPRAANALPPINPAGGRSAASTNSGTSSAASAGNGWGVTGGGAAGGGIDPLAERQPNDGAEIGKPEVAGVLRRPGSGRSFKVTSTQPQAPLRTTASFDD